MRNKHSLVQSPDKFITCPGSRIHKRYESRFDGQTIKLVECGQEDVQDAIEAYAPYTDLNYMLSRLKVGDTSVLCSKKPIYGDLSGMPTNPVDAVNTMRLAESRFLQLPLDTRKAYNNDFHIWLAAVLSGEFGSKDDIVRGDSAAEQPSSALNDNVPLENLEVKE